MIVRLYLVDVILDEHKMCKRHTMTPWHMLVRLLLNSTLWLLHCSTKIYTVEMRACKRKGDSFIIAEPDLTHLNLIRPARSMKTKHAWWLSNIWQSGHQMCPVYITKFPNGAALKPSLNHLFSKSWCAVDDLWVIIYFGALNGIYSVPLVIYGNQSRFSSTV